MKGWVIQVADTVKEKPVFRIVSDTVEEGSRALEDTPELVNTEADRFLSVTAEEVQAAARKYFVPGNMTLLEVHGGQAGQAAASLQAGAH